MDGLSSPVTARYTEMMNRHKRCLQGAPEKQ